MSKTSIGLRTPSGNYELSPIAKAIRGTKMINLRPDEAGVLVLWLCSFWGMDQQSTTQLQMAGAHIIGSPKVTRYTDEELKLACQLCVDREITVKVSKKIISPDLIGGLIGAYELYKQKESKRLRANRTEEEDRVKPKSTSTPAMHKKAFTDMVEYINDKGCLPPVCLWLFIYDHLKADGLGVFEVGDIEKVNELKSEFKTTVILELKKESKSASTFIKNQAKEALNNKVALVMQCRSRYAQRYITQIYLK